MKIGIDISQLVYQETGVSEYLLHLINALVDINEEHEYIFFFSSMRRKIKDTKFSIHNTARVKIKTFSFPPVILDFFWNTLHMFPIEWFIGDVDIFVSSDWTQPPTVKAKKITILYDLIVYKHPQETDKKIVAVQKRRLQWVKKECEKVICISESTKKDAMQILGIEENRLKVIYPGL